MILQQLRNLLFLLFILTLSACSTTLKQGSDTDQDLQQIERASKIWSPKAVQSFEQGNSLIITDLSKAISAFEKAILLEPKMEAAYYNLYRLYYENHDDEKMQKLLNQAKEEVILSARLLTLAASHSRQNGQFKEAEQFYTLALEQDPNHLTALANMGILQDLYLGKLPFALYYYQQYQEQLIIQGKEDNRVVNWLADLKQRISKENKENGK